MWAGGGVYYVTPFFYYVMLFLGNGQLPIISVARVDMGALRHAVNIFLCICAMDLLYNICAASGSFVMHHSQS